MQNKTIAVVVLTLLAGLLVASYSQRSTQPQALAEAASSSSHRQKSVAVRPHSTPVRNGACLESPRSIPQWASEDPDAAFSWSIEQLSGGHFDERQLAVLLAIADHWPERLGEFLDRIADWQYAGVYDEQEAMAGVRTRFNAENLAKLLITERTDCGALADWIDGLPAGQERQRLRAAMARQWATAVDPAEAMTWLTQEGETPANATLDFVLDRWVRVRPAEAAEWTAQAIARGGLPAESMGTAIFRWGKMDTDRAAEWMAEKVETGQSPWLDQALVAFSTVTAGDSPPEAIEWISYIENAELRRSALGRMQKWTWNNKAAWDIAVAGHIKALARDGATTPMLKEWALTLHQPADYPELERLIR